MISQRSEVLQATTSSPEFISNVVLKAMPALSKRDGAEENQEGLCTDKGWELPYVFNLTESSTTWRHDTGCVCDCVSEKILLQSKEPAWVWGAPSYVLGSWAEQKIESELNDSIPFPLLPSCTVTRCLTTVLPLPWWTETVNQTKPKQLTSFLQLFSCPAFCHSNRK